MKLIDLHCDTLNKIYESGKEISLLQNDFHVDFEKLKKAECAAQFFALFADFKIEKNPEAAYEMMIDKFYDDVAKSENIVFADSYDSYIKNENDSKISAFLTLEGADILDGDFDKLDYFYRKGVRLVTITWNYINAFGFPNMEFDYYYYGLTSKGKEFIEVMNSMGIIIDISHLSDQGAHDSLQISKKPVIASHSNSRIVYKHSRNLTDEIIKEIADGGGVVGLNFYSEFLDGSDYSKIEYMIKHLKHIIDVGGEDIAAIGTDFDGIECSLEIEDITKMNMLESRLREDNMSNSIIEKVFYKNAQRVIKEIL